jgi:hypothetical protein
MSLISNTFKRQIIFYLAVLPFVGRNSYERMNSRLDRQIQIREKKRENGSARSKTRTLFPDYKPLESKKKLFFDSQPV